MEKVKPPLLVSPQERAEHFRALRERARANGWSSGSSHRLEARSEWPSPYAPALASRRDEIEAGVGRVEWSEYQTAYSDGAAVPTDLRRLLFGDLESAMGAADHLWASLCHQHAYLSSAALPAYPFIALALSHAPERLAVEILDIIRGFATVRISEFGIDQHAWHDSATQSDAGRSEPLRELASDENEDVRDFARQILEAMPG